MRNTIRNLGIRKKFRLVSVIIIFMMSLSAGSTIFSFLLLNSQIKSFDTGAWREKEYIMGMERLFECTQKATFQAMLCEDNEQMSIYMKTARESALANIAEFEKLKENYSGDKDLLDQYQATTDKISTIREQVWSHTENWQNSKAMELSVSEWIPAVGEASGIINVLMEEVDQSKDNMIYGIQTTIVIFVIVMCGIILFSIVISTILNHFMASTIAEPLNAILKVAESLAHGEFELDITYESADELGETTNALRIMVERIKAYIHDIHNGLYEIVHKNLKVVFVEEFEGIFIDLKDSVISVIMSQDELMKQLQNASHQVSLGAEQLADGAQSLAEGATDQAGAVEELLATVTNVTEHVTDSAKAAEEASNGAMNVGEKSTESSAQMHHMTEAMERISQASKQIEEIIKTIEEIAAQTNLLSLNAAIEAARAGEAGKGFAVVAEEIRNLANQSAQAAVHTRELIETTIEEVDNGDQIANHAAEALKMVTEGIEGIISSVKGIKEATMQQAEEMKQINRAVEQISSVVQNTSATAEESSATSQELSAQAAALSNLTEEFVLI